MNLFVESLNYALRNDVVPVEVAQLTPAHILGLYYFPTWMSWLFAPVIITTLDYYFQFFFGYMMTKYVTMPWLQRVGDQHPQLPIFMAVIINIVLYSTLRQTFVPLMFNFYFK